MFIVAVTLALLAVMGVYGLTATAADVRSAGHMREGLQAQKTGEHSMITTAQTLTAAKSPVILSAMTGGAGANSGQSQNCRSAAPFTGASDKTGSEACAKFDLTELEAASGLSKAPFTAKSFGLINTNINTPGADGVVLAGTNSGGVTVEITDPLHMPPIGSSTVHLVQVTVTTYTNIAPSIGVPPTTVVAGRARMTVGPVANNTTAKYQP